jgi:CDP-glycerol glycerophosphotransferase (TagB/SpsB family)
VGSFSFRSGNAAQLLRIPLHLLGAVATTMIPRVPGTWVFGCATGVGEGALAVWHEADAAGVRTVWLVASPAEAAEAARRGIRSAPKRGLRGFWLTARAQVVVVTHGAGDVNRYATRGSFLVQLWHGIPLKRLGLDSPATARSPLPIPGLGRLLRTAYRRTQRRIRLLPAASHLVRGRLESAFGLDDARVPVTGEPRTDVLLAGPADERRAGAREQLHRLIGDLGQRPVVLYAPTWRDGAPDPAVPSAAEWPTILDALRAADATLLVRSHPLGEGDYAPPTATDLVRALPASLLADVTPVLPAIDVLVTDYSSLAFDTALLEMPVVYLAPDVDAYARDRGFYGRYRDVAGDGVATDWTTAASQIAAVLTDPSEAARRRALARGVSERVHAFRDGRSAVRVTAAILRATRGGRT